MMRMAVPHRLLELYVMVLSGVEADMADRSDKLDAPDQTVTGRVGRD